MDSVKDSEPNHIEQYVLDNSKDQVTGGIPAALLDWSPEERARREKNLVRKIDSRLLIIMLVMYILNYLDRNNIAAAKLAGLQKDLYLTGDEYQPGCLYLLSAWYTRKELVKRTALLYAGSLISGAFSGLISAGITSGLNGARGIAAWRWLFIIEGALTIFVALIAFFIVPNLPRTTPWLSDDEKALAAWRLEEDIGEDDWVDSEHQSMFHGAKLAIMDPKAWLLLGLIYGCTSAGAVTTFFPSVMAGLGKNNIDTLLLTTPPYLIGTIIVLINAWHADRTGERYLHMCIPPIVAIVSFILAMAGNNFAARYVAMCIMLGGIYSSYVVALGYISNILPRPAAKRAAALAFINCLSNVCQIYTPYLYPDSAAPRYITAFSVNIGMCSMTIIFSTILRVYLGRLNKQLDQEEGTDLAVDAHANEEHGLPGLAVRQGFRFLL
ncbi:putative transporter C11D3,18C [Talaromyces islandicus]|uniref:Putative transporter C11D3,18C n=1 Tax=Talaromyces islandicus TaxID=28573 RepID=A0A0U1LRM3_TALIS|nr:putative transporter C11D3,18C [Talaromyces islandicus]